MLSQTNTRYPTVSACGAEKLMREELVTILPPESTDTFKPIAHSDLVTSIVEGLSFRQINVIRDEYAVSEDGMKLFGVLDLECVLSVSLRDSI
jgi:hypothetical protein